MKYATKWIYQIYQTIHHISSKYLILLLSLQFLKYYLKILFTFCIVYFSKNIFLIDIIYFIYLISHTLLLSPFRFSSTQNKNWTHPFVKKFFNDKYAGNTTKYMLYTDTETDQRSKEQRDRHTEDRRASQLQRTCESGNAIRVLLPFETRQSQ